MRNTKNSKATETNQGIEEHNSSQNEIISVVGVPENSAINFSSQIPVRNHSMQVRMEPNINPVQNQVNAALVGQRGAGEEIFVQNQVNFNPNDVIHFLPEFEGNGLENVSNFVQTVRQIKNQFGIGDNEMKFLVIRKLRGKAQKWLLSIPNYILMTFNEILQNLTTMFFIPENRFEIKRNMEKRKWERGESFVQYCTEKRLLSQGLNLTDQEMVMYVIEGIPDTRLRD